MLPHASTSCRWQCSNGTCLQEYGRHSNSIDVKKKVCGACRSPLVFLGKFKPDGTVRREGSRLGNFWAPLCGAAHAEQHKRAVQVAGISAGWHHLLLSARSCPTCSLRSLPPSLQPAKQRKTSKFAEFVKENAAAIKAQLPAGTPQKEVMQRVASMYSEAKQQRQQQALAGNGSQATAATTISLLDD